MTLLEKFIKFFVRQRFRFDMATQFLVFINFALLVITASPQVHTFLEDELHIAVNSYFLVASMVFLAFLSIWLFGFFLDKAKYWQEITRVQTFNNPIFVKILENTEELKKIKRDGK